MKQESPTAELPETLTAKQVEDWLYDHPDFFSQHLNLLENMFIPHPSGEAISLVSKQLELLRGKNRKLSHQLENLIQIAKENDGLFRRMQQLTLALIETETIEEMVAVLTTTLQDCFLADNVALKVINEPAENTTGIADLFVSPSNEMAASFSKIIESSRPKCGHPDQVEAQFLFGESAKDTQSAAIIPLQLGDCHGLLGIGSNEAARFHPSMGNLFLDHIGELVSSRLTSLLNR